MVVGTQGGYGNTSASSVTWGSLFISGGAGSNGSAAATAIAWGTLFICGGGGAGGITSANGNSDGAQISAPANPIFQNHHYYNRIMVIFKYGKSHQVHN